MVQKVVEGVLVFEFPDNWRVSKYDEWTYYRKHFQKLLQGQKAIDIIAVEPKNQCTWLIEVKDYRANRRLKPSDLINEVVQKVLDTLAGLWGAKINARILAEKQLAVAAAKSQQLRVVLHLEQPLKSSKLFPQVIDSANAQGKLNVPLLRFVKCFVRLIPMLKFLTNIIRQNIYGVYDQNDAIMDIAAGNHFSLSWSRFAFREVTFITPSSKEGISSDEQVKLVTVGAARLIG